ncbi:hypothetical protein CsSME_00054770 [Camellia sinensis var. sinensis]
MPCYGVAQHAMPRPRPACLATASPNMPCHGLGPHALPRPWPACHAMPRPRPA